MSVDMFLKLGTIKGESQDHKHKDEIDILSWSWGESNSGSAHQGSGQGAGKVHVQDLTVTKWIDKATPTLWLYGANGKHIPDATLVVRKAGENPLEYLTITLGNIIITSVHTGGSHGEDKLTENVTLNFQKFKIQYKAQAEGGGADAQPDMQWNIAQNTSAF